MSMKKIIFLIDGCNFKGIYTHVRASRPSTDIRSVFKKFNNHGFVDVVAASGVVVAAQLSQCAAASQLSRHFVT
jgi:hypothetical protein